MRKPLLLFALVIACMISCTSDNVETKKLSAAPFPQKWTLVEMTGNIPNVAPLTGGNMTWQEYYVFNDDMTFTKVRDRDGVKSEGSGTYDSLNYPTEKFLELTFNAGADLIGSCGSKTKETLYLRTETEISNTWLQCDGPGLNYRMLE